MVKPKLRGRIHQVAFVLAMPAGAALIVSAEDAAGYVSASIYVASMLALFGTSATYHRGTWSETARARMQRLDHAMIFVLIAGSFTPLALTALDGATGIVALVLAWACAAFGVVISLVRYDLLQRFEGWLYVGFGWLLAIAVPLAFRSLSLAEVLFLFAGGVFYTVGAVGFSAERPDPWPLTFGYHEVWHAFTILGASSHYVLAVLLLRANS